MACLHTFITGEPQKVVIPQKTTNILFQSSDSGESWQDVSAGLPSELQVNCIYGDENEVFLGYDHGIFRAFTFASSPVWIKEPLFEELVIKIFSVKSGLIAKGLPNQLFQSLSGMGVWIPIYTKLKDSGVYAILESNNKTIFVGNEDGILKSIDGGNSWKQVYKGGMILNIAENNNILLASGYKGVYRSIDGGDHWAAVLPQDGVSHSTKVLEGQFFTVSESKNKLSKEKQNRTISAIQYSADGKIWKQMKTNLEEDLKIEDLLSIDNRLFFSSNKGIYRSSDFGKTWKLVFSSAPNTAFQLVKSGKKIFALKVNNGC